MEKKYTKITMSPKASEWFRNEMHLQPGNGIKLFGKGYGETNAHQGFSQGISRCDHPVDPVVDEVIDGIHYYIQAFDEWFFAGLDVYIDYDAEIDGPTMYFASNDGDELDAVSGASEN
ncbi:MAG: iron-sulfur cluster biosynthesis protein [Ligilactobacillus agilis]|nr:iron-sulfur cluster biosynthesis protein [Ligilactobacillus agilis]